MSTLTVTILGVARQSKQYCLTSQPWKRREEGKELGKQQRRGKRLGNRKLGGWIRRKREKLPNYCGFDKCMYGCCLLMYGADLMLHKSC